VVDGDFATSAVVLFIYLVIFFKNPAGGAYCISAAIRSRQRSTKMKPLQKCMK
jgi:hypothetical protein